jgi:hypothetical protein
MSCERCAHLSEQIDRLREALEKTRDYIKTAMRPTSIAAACSEGIYERAHRSGLQHALNAINAEFDKPEALASLSVMDKEKEDL